MVIDQSGKRLRQVWHAQDFVSWWEQLANYSLRVTGDRFAFARKITEELNEVADRSLWIMSSYLPGKIWINTPYQPLYDCLGDVHDRTQWDCSRKFFGLFLCRVLIDHHQQWYAFPKVEKEDGTLDRRQ